MDRECESKLCEWRRGGREERSGGEEGGGGSGVIRRQETGDWPAMFPLS